MSRIGLLGVSLISLITSGATYRALPSISAGIVQFSASPLNLNGESYFVLNETSSASKPCAVQVYINNPYLNEDKLIYSKTYTSTASDVIKYDNSYTYSYGNVITVKQRIGTKTRQYLTYGTISPDLISPQYKVHDFTSSLTSSSSYKTYDSEGIHVYKQTLSFSGFYDYYMPGYYHKFDPSTLRITTDKNAQYVVSLENSEFEINNLNGVFDNFGVGKQTIRFALRVKKVSPYTFELCFAEDLYVEPRTLEMSPIKKEGFVKTNYLFFPRNQMRYQEEYDCRINLNGLGIDCYTIPYKFKLKAILNTMGDCHNSEYCVVNR